MNLRQKILETLQAVAKEQQLTLAGDITDETILLQSGLDSLGFAILVVQLEDVLGYDPFQMSGEAIYPTTFKEFVDVYEKFKPSS